MKRERRPFLLLLLLLPGGPARGVELEVTPDVPAVLGTTRVFANQTATSQGGGGGYTLKLDASALGDVNVDALCRISESRALISTDAPFLTAGNRYGAADVILQDGGTYALYASATTLGITTASANIDGLALDANGDLLVSFQTPTTASGIVFQPSDIGISTGGPLAMFFDANAPALPSPLGDGVNMNGFELDDGGVIYISCDIYVIVGGSDLRSGQVIAYDPPTGNVSTFWQDTASFSKGSVIADFSFRTPAGSVGSGMTVAKDDALGSTLTFTWTASSCPATAYSVYEGDLATLSSGYSHDTRLVTVAGTSAPGVEPQLVSSATYYLVVPRNPDFEGSYGEDSNGDERPGAARIPTGADIPKMSRGCS